MHVSNLNFVIFVKEFFVNDWRLIKSIGVYCVWAVSDY
jgi:hypothetical protein